MSSLKSGMPVFLVNDYGEVEITETRSEPWIVCGCEVIKVKGRAGGYDTERITPINSAHIAALRKILPKFEKVSNEQN